MRLRIVAISVVIALSGCSLTPANGVLESGGDGGGTSSSGTGASAPPEIPSVAGTGQLWTAASSCPVLDQVPLIEGVPLTAQFGGGGPTVSSGCSYYSEDRSTNVLINAHLGAVPPESSDGAVLELVDSYGKGALFKAFASGDNDGTATCLVSVPLSYENGDYLLVRIDSSSLAAATLCADADQILRMSATQQEPAAAGPNCVEAQVVADALYAQGSTDDGFDDLDDFANRYFGGDLNATYQFMADQCGLAFE